METKNGPFEVIGFTQLTTGDTHLAIKKGDWKPDEPVLVRVHSSTETGAILGAIFENYGVQLQKSMDIIAKEGKGVLIYMQHSEKGASLLARLKAYQNNGEEMGEAVTRGIFPI